MSGPFICVKCGVEANRRASACHRCGVSFGDTAVIGDRDIKPDNGSAGPSEQDVRRSAKRRDAMETVLAASDAEIARLKDMTPVQRKSFEQSSIGRPLVERAEKAEAEVERWRDACDTASKVGIDASNLVHALQADLTETLAVVEALREEVRNRRGHMELKSDIEYLDCMARAAAVLEKGGR